DACQGADSAGAAVLGAHIEGPFLNPNYRGAHDPDCLALPELEKVRALLELPPAVVTLAPELPGALGAIRGLTSAGVTVSAGHSGATLAEANAGFDAGIRFGTHLFNAMSPLHHREPGLPGALLADGRVTLGLIADGVHVHPTMLSLAVKTAGSDRIALTTDQTAAAGSPPGSYIIAGRETFSDGTSARLADGTLAGGLEKAIEEVTDAARGGLQSLVEVTPIGLGRRPAKMRAVAEASGVHIIAATGYHRDAHYPEGHWVRDAPVELLAERILADLQEGMHPEDWSTEAQPDSARAGVIKAGASYQRISMLEERRLIAAANGSSETGAPILVHTEIG